MRELFYFIASLAGASILTALAILLRPGSPIWKAILWGGIGVFIACACLILIDYFRPNSSRILLCGSGIGIALAIGCTIALFQGELDKHSNAAPRDPNSLYQYNEIFAEVQGAVIDQPNGIVTFQVINMNGKANPAHEIQYQDWDLICPDLPTPDPGFSGHIFITSFGLECRIVRKRLS